MRPLKFEFSPLDVNALVRSLADFFAEELKAADMTIILELGEAIPMIQGDERFIRQMFINLVKNAMSAMLPGGAIRIGTRLLEDKARDHGRGLGLGDPA